MPPAPGSGPGSGPAQPVPARPPGPANASGPGGVPRRRPHPEAALHTETWSPPRGGPGKSRLVLVHGFTQTGRSWAPLAERLAAAGHEALAVDTPGHGGSARVLADLPAGAELLGQAGGAATYVGYSMGARLALHLALAHPELVRRLVVLGATAGIDDPAERAARRDSDEALAKSLDPPAPSGAPGPGGGGSAGDEDGRQRLEQFLTAWTAQPLFATLPPEAAGLDDRRRNTPAGLAGSLRLAGTGTQAPLWDRLPGLSMPVLVVTGALDARLTALARRLATTIGANATLAVVGGAGHAAHLERPEAFLSAVLAFVGTE
ncbi:MAG: alpha/beta fold hydrolase [Acidimicrobiales bacterium]